MSHSRQRSTQTTPIYSTRAKTLSTSAWSTMSFERSAPEVRETDSSEKKELNDSPTTS